MLDPHGPVAAAIVDLWWLMLVLGGLTFALFAALLVAGLLRRPSEEDAEAANPERTIRRWIGWGGIVLPAVVVAVVFGATLLAMRDLPTTAPPDALEVEIVGHQFYYEIHYPDAGVTTSTELHLPVGQPVALRLHSADVVHSFWVPELGGKLDMLPERVNTLVVEADRAGEFRSRCAEFCGLLHADMQLVVVVEPPDRFDAWLAEQQPGPAADGA